MRSISIPFTLTLAAFVRSLLVAPSSQCADLCGNTLSSTQGQEITCDDADYASSTYGATFKACLACELSSTYVDSSTKQSDLQLGLYNLRFALSWCLFGFDNNTHLADTPCQTSFSCAPLQTAFEYDSLNPNASEYSYCAPYLNSVNSVRPCANCLAETGNEHFLSNFVNVLDAACIQQPTAGNTISIQGNVFSSQIVNATTPTPSSLSHYNPSSGGLTLGAKIGIVVGGMVVILVALGFCIVWRGKRHRRRILAQKARESGYEWQAKHGNVGGGDVVGGGGAFFDSPQSQRPFANAWGHDDSPESANPEKAYFSPYTSQYSSPVSASDRLNHPPEWPRDKKFGLAVEEEQGERIEMTGIGDSTWKGHDAPVLSHPGHGRGASYELTEEDAKAGNAL